MFIQLRRSSLVSIEVQEDALQFHMEEKEMEEAHRDRLPGCMLTHSLLLPPQLVKFTQNTVHLRWTARCWRSAPLFHTYFFSPSHSGLVIACNLWFTNTVGTRIFTVVVKQVLLSFMMVFATVVNWVNCSSKWIMQSLSESGFPLSEDSRNDHKWQPHKILQPL